MTTSSSPQPLSIKVIASYLVMQGVWCFITLAHQLTKISHWTILHDLSLVVLFSSVGLGLWHLRTFARLVAIGLGMYFLLAHLLLAGMKIHVYMLMASVVGFTHDLSVLTSWQIKQLVMYMIFWAPPVWFLFKYKSVFVKIASPRTPLKPGITFNSQKEVGKAPE